MIVKNRKGISTFIATLLLMVLAVSAGVVIYAYVMGYLGGFGGPQTMGAISLDSYTFNIQTTGPDGVTVYVRNIGHTALKFVEKGNAYVNGQQETSGLTSTTDPLAESETTAISFESPIDLVPGTTYSFKVVAEDNTQISFNAKIP
jgi:hypothetical protein